MKISIITCSFNSEKSIAETIYSINKQDYKNIEHILIDGKSSDNTISIINKNLTKKQVIVSEKDNGLYDAMNKGIRMATGDIIGILNSDDFFPNSSVIEKVVEVLKQDSIDAVYGDVQFVHPTDLTKIVRKYSSKIFKPFLMRLGFMPAHPSFYMKRSCYEKYGLYDTSYKICADFELLLRYLYIHQIKTQYIPMIIVTMRTGGVSTNGFSSHKQIMKEHLKALKTHGIYTNRILLSLRYLYKVTEYFKR